MPDVSVVITTRDRPERLARQLDALRAQTLAPNRFEVVVVDDGSGPETGAVLEGARDGWALTVVRNEVSRGPGGGRNAGWRVARAPLIAFTDDDCVATPGWLEALLEAAGRHPDAFLQGKVLPIPDELPSFGPFSHTVRVETMTRGFETANIAYPRALLERLGGFDEVAFRRSGEDTDLAWKAIGEGVEPVFVPGALVHHAVVQQGPLGKLRDAGRWHESVLVYKRHPQVRSTLHLRLFWSVEHWWALRALVALAVPRRLWWLRWWLAAPYVNRLVNRRSGPLLAPYIVLRDAIEIGAMLRGSARYKTLVL